MNSTLMDGAALAARMREETRQEVAELGHVGLATVLVGDDPASEVYIRLKHKAAEEVGIHRSSVERLRKRACAEGWQAALAERPRSGRPPLLDGKQEAVLISLAYEKAAEGRRHWTLRQLAERLVGLEVVESLSHETVRRVLKKTSSSRGRSGRGASPK